MTPELPTMPAPTPQPPRPDRATPPPGIGAFSRAEWLLANGLGGFAMGSASGVPQRRYHAMLIGATRPPVGRVVGLSALAESVAAEIQTPAGPRLERRPLSSFAFRGWAGEFARPPVAFGHDGAASWWDFQPFGEAGGVSVRRSLRVVPGRNAVEVTYDIAATGKVMLDVTPLVSLRDFHQLLSASASGHEFQASLVEPGTIQVRRGDLGVRVQGTASGKPASASLRPDWWWNFEYARDRERGQDCVEDLFAPGSLVFECDASKGPVRVRIVAWMDDGAAPGELPAPPRTEPSPAASLTAAAGQFVVRRDLVVGGQRRAFTSIIAGYPWFSDWGRDTMIALPGLLLTTGRYGEALSALQAFAAMLRDGLVPNCFDDAGGEAQYNTADASLWFIHACCEYRRTSGDTRGFAESLLPACLAIVEAYTKGTAYDIKVDPADGLVACGHDRTQLTWMDAARDGVIFTPRAGKPVEINALWHSVLKRLALLVGPAQGQVAARLASLAARAGESFERAFWNDASGCLRDFVPRDGAGPERHAESVQVRPNQIYAVSLPGSPLSLAHRRAVLACVRDHLLTPQGLRSLAPSDPAYRGRYEGSLFQRDGAYHQGTVWPYLIGAYAEAVLRVGQGSPGARAEASRAIETLVNSLTSPPAGTGPFGSIAEVYDGDEPRRPDGCPMQAWSIAEVLRAHALCSGRAAMAPE